ncbi:GDSL-type esterase/lipase family protein [Paenibacillus sp. FSL L8-0340]|uniref:GDSL-type esterase/lipase family protein n=1 Tax=Paenibacillus sp. FSL L8-0340 TaxID=2954685 RepID=UPI0031593190
MSRKLKFVLVASLLVNLVLIAGLSLVVAKRGGLTYVTATISNLLGKSSSEPDTKYKTRVSVFEDKSPKLGSVVFLGDSITEGNEWAESFPKVQIVNRGISGDTTSGILDRLNQIIEIKPSKVFIMAGINDLAIGRSPQEIGNNISKIVGKIQKSLPVTKVYIQSITPADYSRYPALSESNIADTNKLIKGIADEYDAEFIDLFSVFADKDGALPEKWTYDGLHLNGEAYAVWENDIDDLLN